MKDFEKNLTGFIEVFVRTGNGEITIKRKEFWDELKTFVHEKYNGMAAISFSTTTEDTKKGVHGLTLFGVTFIYIEANPTT